MKCNQCGKGFKSHRALGGQMSTAHAREDIGEADTQASVASALEQSETGNLAGPAGDHPQPAVAGETVVSE